MVDFFLTGAFSSNGPTWVDIRRFSLHTLRDLGFGKSTMEDMISDEFHELRQVLESHGVEPFYPRHDFHIAVLQSLWILVSGLS